MEQKIHKGEILKHLDGLIWGHCRTILHFSKVAFLFFGVFSITLTACNPTNNHYTTENKYIQSNADPESLGRTGGTGDGGGGQGIYCSEDVADKSLKGRLFVRDIYEAIHNHGLTMKSVNSGNDSKNKINAEAFKVLVDSIKHYFGPAVRNLEFGNLEFWKKFEDKISFINDKTVLNYSQDANSPISLPDGCKIVQIAFWHESSGPTEDGNLYVDQKYWEKLDQFNKVALLAHEFFFKQARQAGYKNSDFVRSKVGQLLSTKGLEPVFKEWVGSEDINANEFFPDSRKGFKYCEGESLEDKTTRFQLYQYEGADKLQHFVIPILQSNTITLSLLQNNHYVFDPEKERALAKTTDLMVAETTVRDYSCGQKCSAQYDLDIKMDPRPSHIIENEYWLNLLYNDNELAVGPSESFTTSVLEFLSKNGIDQNKKYVWTGQATGFSGITEVSILNPFFTAENIGNLKLKNNNELINIIKNLILGELSRILPNYIYESEIYSSIAVLNKEVEDGVLRGKYPTGFPKWHAALNKLWSVYQKREEERVEEYRERDREEEFKKEGEKVEKAEFIQKKNTFLESDELTKKLPELLFKVRQNMHRKSDFALLIPEELILEKYPEIVSGFVHMNFKKDQVSLDLSMRCYNFSQLFSRTAIKNKEVIVDKKINPGLKLDIKVPFDSVVLKQFLASVASTKFHVEDLEKSVPGFGVSPCSPVGAYIGPRLIPNQIACSELTSLSNDLNFENKITIGSCGQYSPNLVDINWIDERMCATLKMETLKKSYLIYFGTNAKNPEKIEDEAEREDYKRNPPDIFSGVYFIKQIPYGYESRYDLKRINGSSLEFALPSEEDHFE